MNTIRAKVVNKGVMFNEHARRYMWYPLSNLDMAGTQYISPIWMPKIQRGRIFLLESMEYMGQVPEDLNGEAPLGAAGTSLGFKLMGTDAQVKFLMGNASGSGFLEKGMVSFDAMTDLDPTTAVEIEEMLLPKDAKGEIYVPENLIEMKKWFSTLEIDDSDNPVAEIAKKVQAVMIRSVETAIEFCRTYTTDLDRELALGQNGNIGIKSLSETHKYYFRQIMRPLPEDRLGTNMGTEIAKALSMLRPNGDNPTVDPNAAFEKEIEIKDLQAKLDEANARIEEQTGMIEELSGVADEDDDAEAK